MRTDLVVNACATFRWGTEALSIGPLPEEGLRRLGRLVGIVPTIGSVAQNHLAINLSAQGLELVERRPLLFSSVDEVVMHLARVLPWRLSTPARRHLVHAAAVVRDGAAWLVVGTNRAGKSTLTLEAWLNGAEVIGDDLVLLDAAAGTVEAAPKPLKVRLDEPCLPDRLRGMPPEDWMLGSVQRETALLLGRGLPRMAPLERAFPLGGAFLLRRDPEHGWRTEPVGNDPLIGAVLAETRISTERTLAVLHPFIALLSRGRLGALVVGEGAAAEAASVLGPAAPAEKFALPEALAS